MGIGEVSAFPDWYTYREAMKHGSGPTNKHSPRYRVLRRLELAIARVLHMVSGSWDHRKGCHTGAAFCDGLMIGSAPWLCYCCTRLRMRLEGRRFRESHRPWFHDIRMPMGLRFFAITTAEKGVFCWPVVKWVYPTRAGPEGVW